jgi:UDP-glucose 4-epimerase
MRVLIVGGAGYIGSTAAAHFLKAGHEVTVYDSLVHGFRDSLPEGADLIQADLGDPAALEMAFRGTQPEAVIHFAGYIEAGRSMREPGVFFQNNVSYTVNLLNAMAAHQVKRLVFSSSAAVYASSDSPLHEGSPIGPANVYAETKLMMERMMRWYGEIHGKRYAALRYFNACGAMLDEAGKPLRGESHRPETHLIPMTLQVALGQREALEVFGTDYPTPDGTCIRDYIHVEDLADAHIRALDSLETQAEAAYNLGSGRGYSIRQVVDVARQVTGHPIPVVEVGRRPGDPPWLVAAADKARVELGWSPHFTTLEAIMETAWAWHQAHPRGYDG